MHLLKYYKADVLLLRFHNKQSVIHIFFSAYNYFCPDTLPRWCWYDGHACTHPSTLDIVYRHTPSTIKSITKERRTQETKIDSIYRFNYVTLHFNLCWYCLINYIHIYNSYNYKSLRINRGMVRKLETVYYFYSDSRKSKLEARRYTKAGQKIFVSHLSDLYMPQFNYKSFVVTSLYCCGTPIIQK